VKKEILIERFEQNPLLEPGGGLAWMSKNVFNCGVIKGDDGVWRMLVRGASTDDQSKSDLGLALSVDGISWNLLTKPVLQCGFNEHCTGGIEDPRIVKWIDGLYYIFATASSPVGGRIGVWKTENFLKFEWVSIPFKQEDKNASIFPELIGGFAYLIHRKAPHIWISRTSDASLKSGWQESKMLIDKNQVYQHPEHNVGADKIGIAGPPIRTPKGWLVITHVVHRYDLKTTKYSFLISRSYSLSFILLDIDDPTKVLYVHDGPILWPQERHEVAGTVPNVVFSCATVDTEDCLRIYWGGADTVICGGELAKANLPMCY